MVRQAIAPIDNELFTCLPAAPFLTARLQMGKPNTCLRSSQLPERAPNLTVALSISLLSLSSLVPNCDHPKPSKTCKEAWKDKYGTTLCLVNGGRRLGSSVTPAAVSPSA
jgi:hypothetical protein